MENNIRIYATKISLALLLGILLMLTTCTIPGGNQQINTIRLSIQNTLPIPRRNVPIILTGNQLRKVNRDFSFKAYSVVTGKPPRQVMIPAQADDLDYDSERDQLCFLLNFEPEETKEISILYDPNVKATLTLDINKQTRAAIFPELDALAAIESNLIAYVLKPNGAFIAYGKKRVERFSMNPMFQAELNGSPISPEFRHHFESNDISLSEQFQIETLKPEQQWIIRDPENQEIYFIRKSNDSIANDFTQEAETNGQLDVVKSIGLSLNALLKPETPGMVALNVSEELIGCGGIALWNKDENEMIPLPAEGNYVRILANGSIRSVVQRIIPNWNIDDKIYRLTSTTLIYGENPWIEHHIHIDRKLPTNYALVTGIPNLQSTYKTDKKHGRTWSWGTDPSGIGYLGFALIVPVDHTVQAQNVTESSSEVPFLPVILVPDAEGRLNYHTFAIWGGGVDGIETESEFVQHVQNTATAFKTPPRIKFLPREEGK